MSRSGYTDDIEDNLQYGRWRARVNSAIRGKRGQQFLRDTLAALDAMPDKRLIAEELSEEGQVCTLGATMLAKGVAAEKFDPHDHDGIGAALNIAPCMVQEIEYENDEGGPYGRDETPEDRWQRMRRIIEKLIHV